MRLYFLRHGLADRSEWFGPDFERPLTHKGKVRMTREAETIAELGFDLDAIITSPLARAYQTAEIVADELGMRDSLVEDKRLAPGFEPEDLAEIVQEYAGAASLMLVGHEPDFSETIGYLIGGGEVVSKKGSLTRVDLYAGPSLRGELVWLIPPKLLVL
ncbi:MAG: phosphohistidine phosphatase SixA [Anaerolineae bacterium]